MKSSRPAASLQSTGIVVIVVGLLAMSATCVECAPVGAGIFLIGAFMVAAHWIKGRRRVRYVVLAVGVVGGFATMAAGVMREPGLQQRARNAKAQGDVRAVASAIEMYRAHYGVPPRSLEGLTVPGVNTLGKRASAFLQSVPTPPKGWTPYAYSVAGDGTYTISSVGDNTTARAP